MRRAVGVLRFVRPVAVLWIVLGSGMGCACWESPVWAQRPATLREAAAVIDLRQFELPADAEPSATRHLASTLYYSQSLPDVAYAYVRDRLRAAHWDELPGSYAEKQFASGMFEREGFHLSVSATQITDETKSKTMVSITNQGNLAIRDLTPPAGFDQLFGGEFSAIYLTDADRPTALTAYQKMLTQAGWTPFGSAGEQLFFKQNALRLSVYITTAPAQQNKTSVTLSCELMSVDFPAPPAAEQIEYAESTTTLSFVTRQSPADVFDFYRQHLAEGQWKATTEQPMAERLGETLLFRNPQEDLLTLQIQDAGETRRGTLKHQSAAELADLERLLQEERAKSTAPGK